MQNIGNRGQNDQKSGKLYPFPRKRLEFKKPEQGHKTADAYSAITQSVSFGNLVLTDSDGDTLTLFGVTSTLSEGYFV